MTSRWYLIEILLEEESARAALNSIFPKMIRNEDSFNIHPYNGKKDILKKLPDRLRGYKKWIPPDYTIIVLVDRDRDDCMLLKQKLEQIAIGAGLATKNSPRHDGRFQVLNRIAIDELEAWFFGDIDALVAAYPGIPATLGNKVKYRDPDAIIDTWETLERVLQRAGYSGPQQKIRVASNISGMMIPENNRSASFQSFYTGVQACIRQSQ
ncbi:MAG: hypothetical protein PWP08_1002 [Methanofollis sp.]|nr:hypothetical protein [Methanofollis sp.]